MLGGSVGSATGRGSRARQPSAADACIVGAIEPRGTLMSRAHVHRLSIVVAVVAMLTMSALGPGARSASAQPGADVCPESNDSYATSCYLGPQANVYGFLSVQDDVDMYRVEPLEFG